MAHVNTAAEPTRQAGRQSAATPRVPVAVLVFVAMIVCLLAAMFLFPVNKIVSSLEGKVVAIDRLEQIDAYDLSLVRTLDVKVGQTVAKGQLLATLDQTLTSADVDQFNAQIEGLHAQILRADAELHRLPFDPVSQTGDDASSYLRLQKTLFDRRAAEYTASVLSFDEKIRQQQTTIGKLEADIASYAGRLKIATQVQDMRDTLFKSGSSSKLDFLTASDARIEMQRTMEFDSKTLAETRHQLASLIADRDGFVQQWFSDVSQEILTARSALDTATAQLEKARKRQDLVRLTAPEAGTVLTLSKISVGSVLDPGSPLMTLMPLGAPVQAEVGILARNIGDVRLGDHARLKVDAFNSSEHGFAEGRVVSISADAFTTDENKKPVAAYYKVRLSVEDYHFVSVPTDFRLMPGMTLQADINAGTRRLGPYLVEGAIHGAGSALREP